MSSYRVTITEERIISVNEIDPNLSPPMVELAVAEAAIDHILDDGVERIRRYWTVAADVVRDDKATEDYHPHASIVVRREGAWDYAPEERAR